MSENFERGEASKEAPKTDLDQAGEASTEAPNEMPSCPTDEWSTNPRNLFSENYDLNGNNQGLRLKLMSDGFLSLVQAIIRPPRCIYDLSDLGPSLMRLQRGVTITRNDTTIAHDEESGARGTLFVSEFTPTDFRDYDDGHANKGEEPPVVVYMHGNAGARIDPLNNGVLLAVASRGFSLISFDCAGSGMSKGFEYVSLGWFERLDLRLVVKWARRNSKRRRVAIWGYSMGGAATILYTAEEVERAVEKAAKLAMDKKANQDREALAVERGGVEDRGGGEQEGGAEEEEEEGLAGLVVDSAFSSFKMLAKEHPVALQVRGGPFALRVLYPIVRMRVRARCGLDVNDLEIATAARRCGGAMPPAFFICCGGDEIVPPAHGEENYSNYGGPGGDEEGEVGEEEEEEEEEEGVAATPKEAQEGRVDKRIVRLGPDHDHNSLRPQETLEEAMDMLEPLLRNIRTQQEGGGGEGDDGGGQLAALRERRERRIEDARWGPPDARGANKRLPRKEGARWDADWDGDEAGDSDDSAER